MSFKPLQKIKEIFSGFTDRQPVTLGLGRPDPAATAESKPAVPAPKTP